MLSAKKFFGHPIRLITIDNFYNNCENPLAREYFSKLILLRKRGYGPDYPTSFLPVDAADYVCWHHLVCLELDEELKPIAALRQVSLKRCQQYKLKLPLLNSAIDSGSRVHVLRLEQLIENSLSSKKDLVYAAGAVIDKAYRGQKEFSAFFKEFVSALYPLDQNDFQVDKYICASVTRFKTRPWFEKSGYKPFTHSGKILPEILKKSAENESMLLMEMEKPTDWAVECLNKHRALFNDRIFIRKISKAKIAA